MEQPSSFPALSALNDICKDQARLTGWLRSVIGNEDWHQIMQSEPANHALHITRRACEMHLATLVARIWDQSRDVISLPKMMPDLQPRLDASDKGRSVGLKASFDRLSASETLKRVLVMRTEWLAHRAPNSRDRERLGVVDEGFTYSEILVFSADTLSLIDELNSALTGGNEHLVHNMRKTEEVCRSAWKILANQIVCQSPGPA
ncbi:hypothetical protein [Paracoccus sanguinis]|uniref:AbiU2 domain-containing protein n=1 Tax=Paracoccus sanguinis TaxID=1545044 RepID=UPI0014528513|nr:hypothetical protein [Paracoccus sanguinis]QJD15988.1 hypothetical protein HGN31_03085 [Paracoccus sanguinis]